MDHENVRQMKSKQFSEIIIVAVISKNTASFLK